MANLRTLRGKKCFITGAASGIGLATARAAAAEGAELFLTDLEHDKLDGVVADLRQSGANVGMHAALDISDFDAVRAFAARIHAAHGALDVVMNIAGISVWGTVETLTHRHWRKVVEVNLMGPIHVIECFVPEMIRAGNGGHVVNVSSAAGLLGLPWHAAYSASKFGLRGVSEVLRFDLERHGIGVTLVCPGGVNTPLVDTVEIVGMNESRALRGMKSHFRHSAVTPETAAKAILQGVKRNRYLVFTSNDVRAAHWVQRTFSFAYEFQMRRMNDRMQRLAERSRS